MAFKDLFVTSEPKEEKYSSPINDSYIPEIDTEYVPNYEANPDLGFIDNVYEKADLVDKNKSIFKVEEILGTLPDTLPTDTKRSSVIGILSSFQLSVAEVISDGENRIFAIESDRKSAEATYNSQIADNENTIEELKKKISDLQAENVNLTESKNVVNAAADAESSRINSLINFIDNSEAATEKGV